MIGTAKLAVDKHVGYRYAHVCGILRVLPWRPQRPWTANPRHSWISGQLLTRKIYFAAIFVGWPLATTHSACKPSSYDPVLGPLAPWGPFAHHSDPTIRRPRQEHLHFNSLVRVILLVPSLPWISKGNLSLYSVACAKKKIKHYFLCLSLTVLILSLFYFVLIL